MDLCTKVLSKTSISWQDVQKNLKTRNFTINKQLVQQCTDLLIKHIKNLNQHQVSEQLESLAQSSNLGFSKLQSKDSSNIIAYLHSDDFYFEVPIGPQGEIIDVKFSMYNEPLQSSSLLKDIFCSWNWDLLLHHIDGIKQNYVINDLNRQLRELAFKSLQYLENDLIQINNLNKQQLNMNFKKYINETSLGLFKKSDIGHSMRLYYYLSPQDYLLKEMNESEDSSSSNSNSINDYYLTIASYLTIQLESQQFNTKLPDCSLLLLNAFELNKCPFDSFKQYKGFDVPGTYLIKLNKPLVITINTLNLLQSNLGIRNDYFSTLMQQQQQMSFLKLLAKIAHNKFSDSYYVNLPDETQVYYLTDDFTINKQEFMAIEIEKIPFTHPKHLKIIIDLLRKQLLFNELLLSCMRKTCLNAYFKNAHILEISLRSSFSVSIVMQHPNLLCYTTIEIDLNDGLIQTKFIDHTNLHDPNIINEIIRRSHSIPIAIRALYMKYRQQQQQQQQLSLESHEQQNNNKNQHYNQDDDRTNEEDLNEEDDDDQLINNNHQNGDDIDDQNDSHKMQTESIPLQQHQPQQQVSTNSMKLIINKSDLTKQTHQQIQQSNGSNSNKKRKASGGSLDQTIPLAKRKNSIANVNDLKQQQTPNVELKRHNSMVADLSSSSINSIASSKSTSKLKTSTSVDLNNKTNSNTSINKNKQLLVGQNKTTLNQQSTLNSNKNIKDTKQRLSSSSSSGTNELTKINKKSIGINPSTGQSNKQASNASGNGSSGLSLAEMKAKPMEGLKIRISKTSSSSSSSATGSTSSSIEQTTKQQHSSLSLNNSSSVYSPTFQSKNSSFNTSDVFESESSPLVNNSIPKYEPTPINKKQQQPLSSTKTKTHINSAPTTPSSQQLQENNLQTILSNITKTKSITPPIQQTQTNKSNTPPPATLPIFSTGIIKSGFKIPHKTKPIVDDQKTPSTVTPLKSSTPQNTTNNITNNKNGSSQQQQQQQQIKSLNKNRQSMSSPSNVNSPKYNNNGSLSPNSNGIPKNTSNSKFQKTHSTPLTVTNSSSSSLSQHQQQQRKQSFSQKNSSTPLSPTKSNRSTPTNQNSNHHHQMIEPAPDSPSNNSSNGCETTTLPIPKLIPLERNELMKQHNIDQQDLDLRDDNNHNLYKSTAEMHSPEENTLIIDFNNTSSTSNRSTNMLMDHHDEAISTFN